MELFNFFQKNNLKECPPKSKYENLPLINPQEDKLSPKGYIERKFVDDEYVHGKLKNIFKDSNIPIVTELDFINNDLHTMVLQEKFGRKVRSTQEYFYYALSDAYQNEFLQIVNLLNTEIMKHELPKQYLINLSKINFSKLEPYNYPQTCIKYYPEKNEFDFCFSNSNTKKVISSTTHFEEHNTEHGHILFDENGVIKKAEFIKEVKKERIKEIFKMYKTGFELYQITYMGKIIYKRH